MHCILTWFPLCKASDDYDGCWEKQEALSQGYLLCDISQLNCWNGKKIKPDVIQYTLYSNDCRGTKLKCNAYFMQKKEMYMIAGNKIAPYEEIFTTYGDGYWHG